MSSSSKYRSAANLNDVHNLIMQFTFFACLLTLSEPSICPRMKVA